MGFLPPDTATWPSPLNGTSASVTEFKLMVAFMPPVGGHGGDQEPWLQLGPSVSGSSSWDSWTKYASLTRQSPLRTDTASARPPASRCRRARESRTAVD